MSDREVSEVLKHTLEQVLEMIKGMKPAKLRKQIVQLVGNAIKEDESQKRARLAKELSGTRMHRINLFFSVFFASEAMRKMEAVNTLRTAQCADAQEANVAALRSEVVRLKSQLWSTKKLLNSQKGDFKVEQQMALQRWAGEKEALKKEVSELKKKGSIEGKMERLSKKEQVRHAQERQLKRKLATQSKLVLKRTEELKKARLELSSNPGTPYSKLIYEAARESRYERVLNELKEVSAEHEWRTFAKDFCKYIAGKYGASHVSSLTAKQCSELMTTLSLSWNKFRQLKAIMLQFTGVRLFPAFGAVRENFAHASLKHLYEAREEIIVNAQGEQVKVVVCELTDLSAMLTLRLSRIAEHGKLVISEKTSNEVWLTVVGDKGGRYTRLALIIGNLVSDTNSPYHLVLLGFYEGADTATNINALLGGIVGQVNDLRSVTFDMNNESVSKPVRLFLTGDCKFLSSVYGHKGAAAKNNCFLCCHENPRSLDVAAWDPTALAMLRTLSSYDRDAKSGANSVYAGAAPVFAIEPEQVVPPALHIMQGVMNYPMNALFAAANIQDNGVSGLQVASTIKEQKKQLKRLRNDLDVSKSVLVTLAKHEKATEIVLQILESMASHQLLQNQSATLGALCDAKQFCLRRDSRSTKLGELRLEKCASCNRSVHHVCAAILTPDDDARLVRVGFECFECSCAAPLPLADRIRRAKEARDNIAVDVQQWNDSEQFQTKSVQNLVQLLEQKVGQTRQDIETIMRGLGVDYGAWFQTLTGNQIARLNLNENAVKIWDVVPQTAYTAAYKLCMADLRLIQSSAKSAFLSQLEIDTLQNSIESFVRNLKDASAGTPTSVTEKLHILATHVMPFVREYGTWGLMCEQVIEHCHAFSRRLEVRFAATRDGITRALQIAEAFCTHNELKDTSPLP